MAWCRTGYKLLSKPKIALARSDIYASLGLSDFTIDALKLVRDYRLDVNDVQETFRIKCKHAVRSNYIEKWFAKLQDIQSNPILRTYKTIKFGYSMEPYLYQV